MPDDLFTERQRRLLDAVLILGVVALAFVVINFASSLFYAFGDVVLVFFLSWLLSFALLPVINLVARVPRVPQSAAVIVVYLAIVAVLLAIIIQVSSALATSIADFIKNSPELETQLANLLREIESRLAGIGLTVNLVDQAPQIVANLQDFARQLVDPLQSIAVASIGVVGNILILVILSIYIAIDREDISAFLYRLVPPAFVPQARVLSVSVSKSFGGFLRGQLIMGIVFGLFTLVVNMVFGLQYAAVTTVLAGVLQMIPFFGPFVSWAPPVLVALLMPNAPVLPVTILMGIAWFVTMNILQPRLMSGSVGIHPIVVLGSVVIGSKVAGIAGAIFGIPIAAVISALFFHWVARSREHGAVADRAARRVAAREGREVRRPREPVAGVDEDVEDVIAAKMAEARPLATPAQIEEAINPTSDTSPDPGTTRDAGA
ncbi:MAG TPA: AI-2E family transporter [Candidatus Limnocylindrales bacterium]|nr:AI-2E family transporter [Candidatus Limnocylindrales bacterium]